MFFLDTLSDALTFVSGRWICGNFVRKLRISLDLKERWFARCATEHGQRFFLFAKIAVLLQKMKGIVAVGYIRFLFLFRFYSLHLPFLRCDIVPESVD